MAQNYSHLLWEVTGFKKDEFPHCNHLRNSVYYLPFSMARVAQLVEHQIVDLRVAGSCPVSCPKSTVPFVDGFFA